MTRAARRRLTGPLVAVTMLAAACLPSPSPPTGVPLRVMVVGDSFGLSVGLGLTHYGETTGQIDVLNASLVGCGFGRGGRNRGIGIDREWPDDCKTREARLGEQLSSFHPDVVLCAGGMWDVADRKLAGARRWTHIGVAAYDWYLALELRHLTGVLGQTGAKIVWTTAPTWRPQYSPVLFMGKPPYSEAKPGRSTRYNAVLTAAEAGQPNTTIIDLAAWMRAFPGGEFSPFLRTDGVHFTPQSTDLVANEFLGPFVVAIGHA